MGELQTIPGETVVMASQSGNDEAMRKRILELICERAQQGNPTIDSENLARLVGITESDARYQMKVLERSGYIEIFAESFDGISGLLTTSGEQFVREGVSAPSGGVNVNVAIGAFIQAMHGGNVQAIGNAIGSEVSQVVNDPEQLEALIDGIADQLVEAVRSELPRKELAAYTRAVEDLTAELQRPQRDPSKIKRLLSTLALVADIEGTAGLMTRVWTILLPLVAAADRIMNTPLPMPPTMGPI